MTQHRNKPLPFHYCSQRSSQRSETSLGLLLPRGPPLPLAESPFLLYLLLLCWTSLFPPKYPSHVPGRSSLIPIRSPQILGCVHTVIGGKCPSDALGGILDCRTSTLTSNNTYCMAANSRRNEELFMLEMKCH